MAIAPDPHGWRDADMTPGERTVLSERRRANDNAALRRDEWNPTDEDDPKAPPVIRLRDRNGELPEDQLAATPSSAPSPVPSTPESVIESWATEGRLIHEPTGIASLDKRTGGGPVYGTRWYLLGAPDAGKTALLIQLAHVLASRGVAVGLHAIDEEPGDLVTRLAQRLGYERIDCEIRDATTLNTMRGELGALPIRFYDDAWTIESAAADLAAFAKERAEADRENHPHGPRALLGLDSLQTIACDAERPASNADRDMSEVAAVTARVRAIRAVATAHRLIAVCTSEMGRGAYRSGDPEQQTATLAAAKWSGAVEYSGRVLLGLRNVAGEPDLIDLEIAKNKHWPHREPGDEHVFLRIDRRSQMLSEVNYVPPPVPETGDRDDKARARAFSDAAAVAQVMLESPGLSVRGLRAAVRAATGIGHERVTTSLDILGGAVTREPGPSRSQLHTLDPQGIPEEVRRAMKGAP